MKPFSENLTSALARRKTGQGLFMVRGKYSPADMGSRVEASRDYTHRYAALFKMPASAGNAKGHSTATPGGNPY